MQQVKAGVAERGGQLVGIAAAGVGRTGKVALKIAQCEIRGGDGIDRISEERKKVVASVHAVQCGEHGVGHADVSDGGQRDLAAALRGL